MQTKHKNIDCRYAIGSDVGGSHIYSAVIDLETGCTVGNPIITPIDSKASAETIVSTLSSNILSTKKSSGIKGNIAGAGIAFPGPFDYEHGVSLIGGVGKYDSIYGLDLAASLYSRLYSHGIQSFKFLNDASAFALGEYTFGATKDYNRVVAITLGTGVGSGFIADGKLVEDGNEVPAFGWVYHLPFEGSIVDDSFSTRWICKRYEGLTGEQVTGAKDVADRYSCDENARMLFEEYGFRFGSFIIPILEKFHADALVIGGNISRAFRLFNPSLEKVFAEADCRIPVFTSALLDKAASTGAASLFK